MSLQEEIDTHRKEIHTDSYPMSIGELANLYRDRELDIHPEFQRFFRWTPQQKSRWIESILLGIPLPSIFVSQRPDGVWDVIDGLQRISTILEFMGELLDENQKKLAPLVLEETKLLPSLKGKYWEAGNKAFSLTDEQQRFIKRTKLDIKIILRESHSSSKYELFQRLNTGGSFLSDQELRSCLFISVNRDFYKWIADLAKYPSFQNCIPITDRQIDEQYDLELAVRFVVLRTIDPEKLSKFNEFGEFLTDASVVLAQDKDFNYEIEAKAFKTTFDVLSGALGDDVFKKYDPVKKRFLGAFLISAYEVIAMGIGYNFDRYLGTTLSDQISKIITGKVWEKPDFLTSSGVRANQRLPKTIPFGRELFKI